MTLLYQGQESPGGKKDGRGRAMIETFNSKVDFVDYHSLDQIIEADPVDLGTIIHYIWIIHMRQVLDGCKDLSFFSSCPHCC